MVASATVRYVRISARKVRQVIDLVRGKTTREALIILTNTSKRASQVVHKLLRSGLANAKQKGFDDENLYIARIYADEGPTWKRMRAMSMGRSGRILKRTCHITLELEQKVAAARGKAETAKTVAPAKKSAARSPVGPAHAVRAPKELKPKAPKKTAAKQK